MEHLEVLSTTSGLLLRASSANKEGLEDSFVSVLRRLHKYFTRPRDDSCRMSVILSLSESLKAASMTYGALVVLWLDCPGRLHTTHPGPRQQPGKRGSHPHIVSLYHFSDQGLDLRLFVRSLGPNMGGSNRGQIWQRRSESEADMSPCYPTSKW